MTQETKSKTVDASDLGRPFGQFASGVTVVTARGTDGSPYGATATAFAEVSQDPPLVQVTLTRSSKAARYLKGADFTINILSANQLELAKHFAGDTIDREPDWALEDGFAVLLGNVATLRCRQWNAYDGGDHIIVVGEVLSLTVDGSDPLLSHSGLFYRIGEQLQDNRQENWFSGAKSFQPLAPKPQWTQ